VRGGHAVNRASDPKESGDPDSDESTRSARAWKLTSTIARDPAGIASLVALLIGIILTILPVPDSWSTGVSSVGYALVGGASFSFIYQFWANNAMKDLIISTLDKSQEDSLDTLKSEFRELTASTMSAFDEKVSELILLHRRHWPLNCFSEGTEPNHEFNEMIDIDLARASRYDFRGQSGKHLASRLSQGFSSRLSIRIIIEDTSIEEVMEARIDEKRFGEPDKYEFQTDDEIKRVVETDMLESLIGLHSVRGRFERLELAYASRPTDVRIEIVNGIAYISPFVRDRPRGKKYPEAFRYAADSVPAEVASLEFNREFVLLAGTVVHMTSMTKEKLRVHLESKGWQLTKQEFEDAYRRAEQSVRYLGSTLTASAE
jgi:hypothetical protein